jgi:hypothetical protein
MAKAEKTTEVAVIEKKSLAVAMDFMDESDFGGGFEGADKDSYAIPFLQVLQKMSPLVDEDKPQYIKGAKAGMFYNTVTQKLYDGKEGIKIIPCAFKRAFIQWGARDAGGGFKGEFTPEAIEAMLESNPELIQSDEGRLFKPLADGKIDPKKSDYYADTRSHFVLIVDEEAGEVGQAILSITGTLTKASRMLMTSLQQKKVDTPRGKQTPPTFANLVTATTFGMSNDKGSWSGIRFELEDLVKDPSIYAEAKAFYKAIVSGEAKADYSKSEGAPSGEVSDVPTTAEGF